MRGELAKKIISRAHGHGYVRARDLDAMRIERVYLSRLCAEGVLLKVGRGIYVLAGAPLSEWHSLAVVTRIIPKSIVCLLSAVRFHQLGTQYPHEVWIALERRLAKPRLDHPKVRVVWPSGPVLTKGIETHTIEGTPVRIFGAAKTVADCFKYRNKIGLDVAIEALREGKRTRKFTNEDLWKYAKIDHVAQVMRPYLEALA